MNQNTLPNATAVLVLGILSILGSCCYGIPGIICGVIALFLAKKDLNLYKQAPGTYSNYGNLNAGKIMAIIGIVIGILLIAYILFIISSIGWSTLTDPEALKDILENR